VPGEQQSEVEHDFRGDNTNQGAFNGRTWRDARGSFSYQLKAPTGGGDLLITCYGRDNGRKFDILINDRKLTEVMLDGKKGDSFFDLRFTLPPNLNTQTLTVKFAAHDGSVAGGIFDVRIVRSK
jgi:hypothetical protein